MEIFWKNIITVTYVPLVVRETCDRRTEDGVLSLQEYSVQLTFREQWLDERLKFNDFGGKIKYLTLTDANRVWMPDLFFSNEKEGHFHNIIMPNVYIRIFPYGSVLYSIR
uniref:Neurotransmitter-gated ion-channel ligand-binding domain-containing protein n=1 Tax=Timema bartmani TaxID=61472 RepID=A0A7R9EP77_9NEOP|nr:unnamed protein product [Timema bartmani]